ncbi:hypothetical protein ACTS9T_18525 [Empedobacter falsenii]|jgi:hypothetical protein|uniref:hypothetical protein n=1 Tax=Empedobacter TaxID=59734 RepID=UPI001CE17F70|nr:MULTISPECIES: hypothetical protein [Empedobacter]MCA4810675.1 toxin-antitoxin system protein [Empedobacter stercoris]MDM1549531.1 toxin-antitoxin system protein [Empedobacter falsenii]
MNTKEKRLTSLRINNNLYEFLKKEAIKSNRSFNNYIETILLDATGYSIPNSETISAMEELKNNSENLDSVSDPSKLKGYLKNLLDD